jgi:hypothetical protein
VGRMVLVVRSVSTDRVVGRCLVVACTRTCARRYQFELPVGGVDVIGAGVAQDAADVGAFANGGSVSGVAGSGW